MNGPTGIETTLRTLLRSANPAATGVLAAALESDDSRLRVGAVRVLAKRREAAGHRLLVERYERLPSDAQAALTEVSLEAPLSASLREIISPSSADLALSAARLADAWRADDTLPQVARCARTPGVARQSFFAELALGMALRVASDVERYRRGDQDVDDRAFTRRAAVTELGSALRSFDEHGSEQLVEAFLALTPADEEVLHDALDDPSHPAHRAVHGALVRSTHPNALAALGWSLVDPRAPAAMSRIAGERHDVASLAAMFARLEDPIGVAAREACSRIERLAWLDDERVGVVGLLDAHSQSVAMQVAASSGESRRRVATAIGEAIRAGKPLGQRSACRAIGALPSNVAVEPLTEALRCDDARTVAAAAKLLRKKNYPHATHKLIALLEHTDADVRRAAQQALEELSFGAYRDHLDELPEEKRREVGQLVGRADPLAASTLRAEMRSGAVSRRLKALELVDLMEMRIVLLQELIESATDSDAGVRGEAIRLLGQGSAKPDVVAALRGALDDGSPSVRDAAERALGVLGVPTVLLTDGE